MKPTNKSKKPSGASGVLKSNAGGQSSSQPGRTAQPKGGNSKESFQKKLLIC